MPLSLCLTLVLAAPPAAAPAPQAGDRKGEVQADLPADLEVPAAPVLTPEEALGSFTLAPGLAIELVAAEPLVVDPVAFAFDGEGRLWVAEMRGYMPDVDGRDEAAPVGVIAVLSDTDGDGRMDTRQDFLEGLVLPRAVAPYRDGVLFIEPPGLDFARDTDGDGRADERLRIDAGIGGIHSPEHAQNGLLFTHDNWIRSANAAVEYRERDGVWERRRTAGGGQWGITQDDLGRVFFNTNSDPLRGDRVPSYYAARNPNHGRGGGTNVRFADDRTTWPIRITPGVNRGYQPATLRDDFTLATFTAACAPWIFRGSALPEGYRGNAFVCEPAGNLIKRYLFDEVDGRTVARPAWEGREFLASTDERFRPVALCDGPDGALYIADFYRGIIQHRVFVTSFLRKQILERGLDEPLGMGRIWRVVATGDARSAAPGPDFPQSSWGELVDHLAHPDAWWRETAQRVLVEEGAGERDARELLEEQLAQGPPLARRHVLWTLEGIGALRRKHVMVGLGDDDARVREAAVRLAEIWMAQGDLVMIRAVADQALQGDGRLATQVLLSLGEAQTRPADEALVRLVGAAPAGRRDPLLSGLYQRELGFLRLALGDRSWGEEDRDRAAILRALARAVTREGRSDHLADLLDVLVTAAPWQRAPLVAGVLDGRPPGPKGEPGRLRLASEPSFLADLGSLARGPELLDALAWPGKPGLLPEEEIRPLDEVERARFLHGRELYAQTCASCHQSSGRGDAGKAPPLYQSPWVLGDEERLLLILLHGLEGPIELDGRRWDLEMPALVAEDVDVAALATYVRREWGHGADPVEPATVGRVRGNHGARGPWTVEEFSKREPNQGAER